MKKKLSDRKRYLSRLRSRYWGLRNKRSFLEKRIEEDLVVVENNLPIEKSLYSRLHGRLYDWSN